MTFREGQKISVANSLKGYTWYIEGVKPHKYQDTNPNGLNTNQGSVNFLSPIIYKIVANHTDGGFSKEFRVVLE